MLARVEVENAHGSVLSLPLYGDDNVYQVMDITGLDPVEVDFSTIKHVDVDGTEYQSASRGNRNLVFDIAFNPDYSTTQVSQLRTDLYKYFMPKQKVKLKFYDSDGDIFIIEGRVESHDSPRFVSDPSSTISILCFNPDFIMPNDISVNGTTTATNVTTTIDYLGSVETGFVLTLPVTRDISEIVFVNTPYVGFTESLRLVTPLLTGDTLRLSTVVGDKSVSINRGGVLVNGMSGVSPYSVWPRLWPGGNTLRVFTLGPALPYTLTYRAKYGAL